MSDCMENGHLLHLVDSDECRCQRCGATEIKAGEKIEMQIRCERCSKLSAETFFSEYLIARENIGKVVQHTEDTRSCLVYSRPVCDACRRKAREGEIMRDFYSQNIGEPWSESDG